ncbi:MAG: SIS domain-containing protein [Chloroflexota bacterium]|nr:SIS domain-containing protein [Chloroflexota bacterium]
MTRAYHGYARALIDLIEQAMETQASALETASGWMADSIVGGGVVHLFGSGHAHMVAEEVFHRAGSLMPCNPMLDPNLTFLGTVNATLLERNTGYGGVVVASHDIRPGEVVIVASNSGVNPVPIDVALSAQERGARTVALTSDRHYRDVSSRHGSGKRLAEVADLTIDTLVPRGDALVEIDGVETPAGGASSAVSIALVNALMVETAEQLQAGGIEPPLIPTMNVPGSGGDERMAALVARYVDRLPLLHRA